MAAREARNAARCCGFGLVVVALAGCGRPSPAQAPHDERPWPLGVCEPAHRPGDLSHRERGVLDMPWAGPTGPDLAPADPPRRFIVNLTAQGDVYFKGVAYPLSPERKHLALENLGRGAAEWTKPVRGRERPTALLVRADYHVPWADVRDVLSVLRPIPGLSRGVSFATASTDESNWVDRRIDADATDGSEARVSASVGLEMVESPGAGASPRLQTRERALAFSPGDPYQAGSGNDVANANWRAFLDGLRDERTHGVEVVSLAIGDRVPWAYVAMTLGMLLEAGIPDVRLEGVGPLRLSIPSTPKSPWRPGDRDPRDWPPAVALGVGAALALAVVLVGAIPGRRRRARPSSPRPPA
jgi:hypothetical protein